MSRDLLIWMAGFFDGEGCVSISRGIRDYGPPQVPRKKSASFALTIIVEQKSRAPLEHFVGLFGGTIFMHRSHGLEYYRWRLASKKAADALVALLPYLQVKREVAELAIRFQEQMTAWHKQYSHGGYPMPIRQALDGMWVQSKALNQRRKADRNAPAYEGPRAVAASKAAVNEG